MHVLIIQTNLYTLKLYYLFILKYYTYVSIPITRLIYVTVTYLLVTVCQHPSVYLVPYGQVVIMLNGCHKFFTTTFLLIFT